eukprot:g2875.t1
MGATASFESVQKLDANGLAQLAVDNNCPPIVKKTIEENFIDGRTVSELNDEIIESLATSPIQRAQLLGAFRQLSPSAGPTTQPMENKVPTPTMQPMEIKVTDGNASQSPTVQPMENKVPTPTMQPMEIKVTDGNASQSPTVQPMENKVPTPTMQPMEIKVTDGNASQSPTVQPMENKVPTPTMQPMEMEVTNGKASQSPKKREGLAMKFAKAVDPSLAQYTCPVLPAFLIFSIVFSTVFTILLIKVSECREETFIGTKADQQKWRTLKKPQCVLSNKFLASTTMEGKDDVRVTSTGMKLGVVSYMTAQCFPAENENGAFPTLIKGEDTPFCTEEQRKSIQSMRELMDNPDFKYKEAQEAYTQEYARRIMKEYGPCPEEWLLYYATSYRVCADPVLAMGAAFGFAAPVKLVATTLVVTLLSLCRCIKKVKKHDDMV